MPLFEILLESKDETLSLLVKADVNEDIIANTWKLANKRKYKITSISLVSDCEACRLNQLSQWAHCEPGGCLHSTP